MTLTAEQLSVVNLVSGRHLVLAPPGSGKTEMLSQRIIRALALGVDPGKMLCATFTNREADDCESLVRGLGYLTVKVSGRDLFAYPLMRDFLAFVSLFVEKPPQTAWASLVRRFADGNCGRNCRQRAAECGVPDSSGGEPSVCLSGC